MATNPMQRKSRNSFLLGMLLTLVIAGLVIALLVIQLKNYKDKEAEEQANSVKVWVLGQNVISGQVITTDMLTQQVVNKNLVPSNAIGNVTILDNYALEDKEGNEIITEYKNNSSTMYLSKNGTKYELTLEDTGNYSYTENREKKFVDLSQVPIIAKVDMNKNTIITPEMISKSDEKVTDDLRKQEYNMLQLQTQIESGEYIDVRLSLPNGLDYIVISKKQVEFPQINGTDSEDTIWLKLKEDEILAMNNAIVESYKILGSRLYITPYVEAGMQTAATPTYVPSAEVINAIRNNPNIVQTAKDELVSRYSQNASVRNDYINPAISASGTEGEENVKTKVQESVTATKTERKEYLDSLSGE